MNEQQLHPVAHIGERGLPEYVAGAQKLPIGTLLYKEHTSAKQQAQPVAYLVQRHAFRASPHGQDAEGHSWLEVADDGKAPGAVPVYTQPPHPRAQLMRVAEAVRTAMVQSCEAWGGIVEATKRVYLAAIVDAIQPQAEPAADVAQLKAATNNWPSQCPITRRDFFMEIDGVPTYGGPYDSYTIPEMTGEPTQPWHERELFVRRYDHDRGGWVEDEFIPLRVIHEDVLMELEDAAESTQAQQPLPDIELFDKTIEDFESCGETDTPQETLMQFAHHGWLHCVKFEVLINDTTECVQFQITNAGRAALAAHKAQEGE